ncbi:hypothetical protein PBT90_03225 [Algoriphagus halophytocola]|uniref:DUF3341 domain-containing protein n=1 Tax=Algoriphagus halophytocola TaxID=2991499 RepID=A0ABY6MF53_9BACT|nr:MULTISPECIES: hypothetical protein [unclassified Algoriphagus]UZD22440.1 hypothetical protein OM944_17505 [Algoriphagus sp. TR-M5]WBL43700.1 hypothetical protein PBT90_03225 [Algoriphagus sp. TR-M9]
MKDQDAYFKKLLVDAGVEDTGKDFHKGILAKLSGSTTTRVYTPVISTSIWKLVAALVIGLFFTVLIFLPSGTETSTYFTEIDFPFITDLKISWPKANISMPTLTLPTLMIQAMVAFAVLVNVAVFISLRKLKYV